WSLTQRKELHPVEARQRDIAKRGGQLAGSVDFVRLTGAHRAAAIQEQVEGRTLVALAKLDVELVQPGEGVPINLPDVVTRRVGTLLDVVAGPGPFQRAMFAGPFATDWTGRNQRQALQPAQE